MKAQKTMVTVPTLSVSSAISFSVSGMIGACPLELLVDTGATVSLLNKIKSTVPSCPWNNGLVKSL